MNILFPMADEMTWWALSNIVHTSNLDRSRAREVGGRAALLAEPQWNFTPAYSR